MTSDKFEVEFFSGIYGKYHYIRDTLKDAVRDLPFQFHICPNQDKITEIRIITVGDNIRQARIESQKR